MADHQRNISLIFVVLFSCLAYSSYSYQFVAGGRDGWVVKPSEDYNQWAQRMRFQVNDTILFKYKSGSDSVMVVNKDDYDKCNVANPLLKLDDGNSVFKFDRSGAFYFISGNKTNCDQGQKLHVVVMAVRTPPSSPNNAPPPAATAPPQGSTSPSLSPAGGAAAPGPANSPLSPSGGAPAPATSPASLSPAPAGSGPGEGLAPAPGSPSGSPGSSMPGAPGSSTPGSGAPGSSTPGSGAPGSSTPGSGTLGSLTPGSGAPGSSTPGSGTPGEANSPPAPPRSMAAPCRASVSLVSLVLSVGLGVFVFST